MLYCEVITFFNFSRDFSRILEKISHIFLFSRKEKCREIRNTSKDAAREATVQEWQNRWRTDSGTAKWTKTLIKDLKRWLQRDFGSLSYQMTQIFTGHGCFMHFVHKIGKREDDKCMFCGEVDTAEHTFFDCPKWTTTRSDVISIVGIHLTPDNLVDVMLGSRDNWTAVSEAMREIITQKELCLRSID